MAVTFDETTRFYEESMNDIKSPDQPQHRYDAVLAGRIERKWQDFWEENRVFDAPNPVGDLADPQHESGDLPKLFVMDMFPYPSGAGLHVGHPFGYIATDCYSRFKRMDGFNVMHPMAFDAFGLPTEQYAIATGEQPAKITEANIATFRKQLRQLGLGYDSQRSFATSDPDYYKWTQWIFLQIFNAWFDEDDNRARHIDELIEEFESGQRAVPGGQEWSQLSAVERRTIVDEYRLAYVTEAPVNWCPGLGTVLSNEEVTAEGRSERGNFPVYTRKLKQWMMRITAYSERLLEGLDRLDWPESTVQLQRNWIGKSTGSHVRFSTEAGDITVFTTRPDTLFGSTYMVLAPEHPLVDALTVTQWASGTPESWTGAHATPAEAVAAYRAQAAAKTDVERQGDTKTKTGVFTGSYATNPVNGKEVPVFIADYVLINYGTGAIMAVPGHDERDWDFATTFDLPIVSVVESPEGYEGKPYSGEGKAINSDFLNGLPTPQAKTAMVEWLTDKGYGEGTTTYRLRDWLFSRQRYWGEPFPIVYDESGLPVALPESMLPVVLPEVDDYAPRTFDPQDADTEPEPPLGRATEWVDVTLDLGDGPKKYRRELNTMPNWAGSCWYQLRYTDPHNKERFADPRNESYWMQPQSENDCGGVDLYVGGQEHAVLHLLYDRFWQQVMYDLGHVSSPEPFRKLIHQGMIQAYAYTDERGAYVPAHEVLEESGKYFHDGKLVAREYGKIGKSLKNVVTPGHICEQYGADTFRLYEMSMGPLEIARPWETRAVVGSLRFLQRLWRNIVDEETGECVVVDAEPDLETRKLMHRTIATVRTDMDHLRMNTAIAKLISLNNHVVKLERVPREVAENLVLMVSPFAPHAAEELWRKLGHSGSVQHVDFPREDQQYLTVESVTYPIQVNGKVRDRIDVAVDASQDDVKAAALATEKIIAELDGREPRKVIVVPGRMVSVVL